MATLAQPRARAAERMYRPDATDVRRESIRGGLASLLIRIMIVGGLLLTAWQVWSHFTAAPPAPAPVAVPAETIAGVQITLGQAALALRDFGKSGLLSDRFDFEQGVSRVRRSVEALDGSVVEGDERQALARTKALLEQLVQIEKEHIIRLDAGASAMTAEKLASIASARDAAALALTEFREAGVRRVASAVEPDSVSRLLGGAAGAGAGLLSLCIAAITLWSRLFPA
jgi:hypothetical protein